MANAKRGSKRKTARAALPFLSAAGASLAMTGGASAAAVPAENLPPQNLVPHPTVVLGEEELADVNLATFYVLDQEDAGYLGVQVAARCGGCRGCGRCAAARCAVARCAVARCGGRCAVARCRCGVGVVGCARCGCSCAGCGGTCWTWLVTGWVWVC
jgi:hypothetical protein